MYLKKLSAENFKGQRQISVDFEGNRTRISGCNGSGKTTLATLYYWIFSDCDYELNSNPNVKPDGEDEAVTIRGDAVIEVGGKEVCFSKVQKIKSKTGNDGKTKTSKINSYEVNGVPKSQRDAFKYLECLGFDSEKFLPISHSDCFLRKMEDKKGRQGIRDVLFGMTDDITDAEVAEKKGLSAIRKLLEKYGKDEIVAMQNSTKRKIAAEYGKNGEILDVKIDGLASAKVDADGDTARKKRDELTAKIADIETQIAETSTVGTNADIAAEINALEQKKREHLERLAREIIDFNWEARNAANGYSVKIAESENRISNCKRTIADTEATITRLESGIKEKQAEYKNVKASEFDDSKAVCPVCKRRYSAKKVAEMAENFEADKKSKLEYIAKTGKELSAQRDKMKENKIAYEKKLSELETELKERREASAKVPEQKEVVREDDATKAIDAEVAALKAKLRKTNDERKNELVIELSSVREELNQAVAEIVKAESNENIDRKISELQSKRIEFEQEKLNCERILDEINQLEMAKNEMLTEQINSHFKLVKWVLFERQANGEILTDRCTPYIDGKSMVDEANTGRVILGKLDIVEGLQNFYGQRYPVWLDNAEALTSNTIERIELNTQLIMLSAVDGSELTVK